MHVVSPPQTTLHVAPEAALLLELILSQITCPKITELGTGEMESHLGLESLSKVKFTLNTMNLLSPSGPFTCAMYFPLKAQVSPYLWETSLTIPYAGLMPLCSANCPVLYL